MGNRQPELLRSLTLSFVAVPAALAVAWVSLRAMKAAMPPALVRFVPGWDRMHVSLPLLGWTALAAVITGALFGLLPAWQASGAGVLGAIKSGGDGGRSQTAGRGRNRTRRALVVAEVALALPLLVASTLAVLGVQRFVNGSQGYDPNGLVRASVVLPDPAYASDESMRQFASRLVDEVGRLPGVTAVALARLMEQAMFGTVSLQPGIFGSVALILFAVAALSSFLPARDATRVDPAKTLRD